jgi:predicted ester cyclase
VWSSTGASAHARFRIRDARFARNTGRPESTESIGQRPGSADARYRRKASVTLGYPAVRKRACRLPRVGEGRWRWPKRRRASNAGDRNACFGRAVGTIQRLSTEQNKLLVRRLVDEAVAHQNVDILAELAAGEFAAVAKRWVRPFQSAFPDFEMRIVELIAEGDTVVGHFKCSGTHLGEWLGVPATGRRFENVDEIYIFQIRAGKLVSALGVEDNLTRLHQLGINPVVANPIDP